MSWNNSELKFEKGDKDRFGYELLDRANVSTQNVDLWLSPDGMFYRVSVPKNDNAILSVRFDNKVKAIYNSYELYRSYEDESTARKTFEDLVAFKDAEENDFFVEAARLLRSVEPKLWILTAAKQGQPMVSLPKWYNENLSMEEGTKDEQGNRLHRRKNVAKGESLDMWETPDRKYIVCVKENEDNVRVVPTEKGDRELSKTFDMPAYATRFFNAVMDDTALENRGMMRGNPESLYKVFVEKADKS